MGATLERRFDPRGQTARAIALLAKTLSADDDRLEVLRFNFGVRQISLRTACRRIDVDGTRALLVVGMQPVQREALATRAEGLADAIADEDTLVAVLDDGGRVLGASGGFDSLASRSGEIDVLIDRSTRFEKPVVSTAISVGGRDHPAGVARARIGDDTLLLLIVGPAEPMPVRTKVPAPAIEPEPETVEAVDEPVETERAREPDHGPPSRFWWRTDRSGRFTLISDELGQAVGTANAPNQGETWPEVVERLRLDGSGRLEDALGRSANFSGLTVFWPVVVAGDRIAIDLAGMPAFSRDGAFEGYRGFGVIRADVRRPDAAGTLPRPEPVSQVATVQPGSNVVSLDNTPTRILPHPLAGHEKEAFARIAEALSGSRRKAEPNRETEPQPPAPADFPVEDFSLLDKVPVALVVYRDRRTLFVNRALLELLGYVSRETFEASGGVDVIFPENRTWYDGSLAGPPLHAVHADGSQIPVDARLHSVSWAGGTALLLTLSPSDGEGDPSEPNIDWEDDDAAADRLEELEAVLDTATDGVVIVEEDGRVDRMNRSAEALFGMDSDAAKGSAFADLFAEESRKDAQDYLEGLAANGVRSVLNDGREVIGRFQQDGLVPLFMTMGRLAGSSKYCAVLRDITHWKKVEEELVAARKAAETANAQKSEFLAKISHEIRTPLNAILGFSEVMIAERFGPVSNDRYRSYLRDIHLSGEHLMSLINDLLDLSKVEAGKLELDFKAVSANEVIQECVALMQPQANRDRIIIRTSLAQALPNVVVDLRSFRQILLNLLSNAVKFTNSGGQVIVSTALEDSGEVVVRVRDTGVGMSEQDIEVALKPFRQVANNARVGEGTGLGLPLTKALVEANRARFAIESVPDQGTLVRITFPTTRVLAG